MTRLDPAREGAADIVRRKRADMHIAELRRLHSSRETADRVISRYVHLIAPLIAAAITIAVFASYWE